MVRPGRGSGAETLSSDVLVVDGSNWPPHGLLFLSLPLLPLKLSPHVLRQQGLVAGDVSTVKQQAVDPRHQASICFSNSFFVAKKIKYLKKYIFYCVVKAKTSAKNIHLGPKSWSIF